MVHSLDSAQTLPFDCAVTAYTRANDAKSPSFPLKADTNLLTLHCLRFEKRDSDQITSIIVTVASKPTEDESTIFRHICLYSTLAECRSNATRNISISIKLKYRFKTRNDLPSLKIGQLIYRSKSST